MTGDAAIPDALAGYNKEDCLSTSQMRGWLESILAHLLADTRRRYRGTGCDCDRGARGKRRTQTGWSGHHPPDQ